MSRRSTRVTPLDDDAAAQLLRAHGLTVEREGQRWRVIGPKLDVSVAALNHLSAGDLPMLSNRARQRLLRR